MRVNRLALALLWVLKELLPAVLKRQVMDPIVPFEPGLRYDAVANRCSRTGTRSITIELLRKGRGLEHHLG